MRSILFPVAAVMLTAAPVSAQFVAGSILPTARSVEVGEPATAFASMINTLPPDAPTFTNCRPECVNCGPGGVDATYSYQTTTPANTLTGTPNTPADIAGGQTQNFLFTLVPNSSFSEQGAIIDFVCDGDIRANYRPGLSVFTLSANPGTPDILTISSTLSGDGVARVLDENGFIPFAVAAINIGSGDPASRDVSGPAAGANGATITVTPEDGGLELPVRYDVCEANSLSQCIGPRGATATATIGDQPSFFVVRAIALNGATPFFPDITRTDIVFSDASGIVRGRTSVGTYVLGPETNEPDYPSGIYSIDIAGNGVIDFGEFGTGVMVIDAEGNITANASIETFGANGRDYGFFGAINSIAYPTVGDTRGGFFSDVSFIFDGNGPAAPGDYSGTWEDRAYVSGSVFPTFEDNPDISRPGFDVNQGPLVRSVFNDLTNRTVTLAGLAGSYDMIDVDGGTPTVVGQMTIASNGDLTGTIADENEGNCAISGSLSQFDASQNIFTLAMTLAAGCNFEGSYSGHGAQTDDADLGITDGVALLIANANVVTSIALAPQQE